MAITLNNGFKMPVIGLGVWRMDKKDVKDLIFNAINLGYRHFDCAADYQNEAEVGEALAEAFQTGLVKREDLFITTKLWNSDHGHVHEACKDSLKKLQLDYLDLYLVHFPVATKHTGVGTTGSALDKDGVLEIDTTISLETTWHAMENLVSMGLVRSIGISNYDIFLTRDCLAYSKIKPAVNQIETHPYFQRDSLVKFCLKHGVSNTDWSSSLSSALYRIDRWGPPYFEINASGNVIIRPFGDATLPHQEIDLLKVVKKVSDEKSNGGLGLQFPLIVRFPDVLKHRLESLQCAFDYAVQSHGYGSHYQGVYPVKCNQDRFVVEDIVQFGSGFRFGLEAGSKPELLLAMSCLCKGHPDAFLVCNGFKDAEYISLAIIATKLALNTVIVLEQEEEVDLVIELSQLLGTRPVIGVRAKLRTKHAGHFGSTSGEKGKFGLTTVQILRVVRKLDAVGMLDCLQLLHFHIGSQIPSTALLSDGVAEGAQVYCELVRLGACMRVIDIGGGLGIDYDGSKSTESDISVGYTLEEYASAVVGAVQVVCDRKGTKHPVICSESGRAIVSHHSILVFEAVSSSSTAAPSELSPLELRYLAEELTGEARVDFDNMYASAMRQEYDGCMLYADQMKQRCIEQFKNGCVGMEQLAAVDELCEMVSKTLGVGDTVSTYNVNLSVFTSIPDFWGIGQLFPIIPIHKHDQRPCVRGILSDLTCDSDGKIDKFIGGESSLPLHELRKENGVGGGYYLGMFLGGAYEEALGGVHNLFGGPSVVRVLQSDGPHSFAVTRAVPGPSSSDVLRVMQHEPELMFQSLKHRAEECLNRGEDDTAALADGLAQSFNNMPYLVAGSAASSCGFINSSKKNNANGYHHHPYYCGAEDSCNVNAVEVANGEEEQWSYVCA